MVSEAARAALGILLVATATMCGAWGYTALNGPLTDQVEAEAEREGVFLVTYRLETWDHVTETQAFPANGRLSFPDIPIPLQNVSTVDVTLQIHMEGPALNDDYTVTVVDPQGEERSGSHAVPSPSMDGYIRSDTIIHWSRAQQPSAETYQTPDRDEASQWSAENHTDQSAQGDWEGSVTLNQPTLGRNGNASLLLRFTWYEAVILPHTRPTVSTDPPPPAPGNDSTEADFLEVVPRTFITSGSVGGIR